MHDASHTPAAPEEPLLTILQKARDREAFYRLDWMETTGPELLVLLSDYRALEFSLLQSTSKQDASTR